MKTLKEMVQLALEASDPLIVVESNDQNAAILDLITLCEKEEHVAFLHKVNVGMLAGVAVIADYVTSGIMPTTSAGPKPTMPGQTPAAPVTLSASIMSVQQFPAAEDRKCVLLLQNPHRALGENIATMQTVMDALVWFKNSNKSIVLLVPKGAKLPVELAPYYTKVSHPEPDDDKLREIIRHVGPSGPTTNEELLERAVASARGLTALQTESTVARVLLSERKLDPAAIWEHKVELFNHDGLVVVHKSTAGLDKLGGLYFFKDVLSKQVQKGNLHKVFLMGPAGCGKTSGAFALGYEYKLNVLEARLGTLFGMYVGQSEERSRYMQEIFEKNAPCIVVMDELPRYLSSDNTEGKQQGNNVDSKVGAEWLTWLSSKRAENIMIVATANEWAGVSTMVRSERFNFKAYTSIFSSMEKRKAIWDIYIKEYGHEVEEALYNQLLNDSGYWTGAEIKAVCRLANKQHLDESIAVTLDRVGIDWDDADRRRSMQHLEEKGTSGAFLNIETGFKFNVARTLVELPSKPIDSTVGRRLNLKKKKKGGE